MFKNYKKYWLERIEIKFVITYRERASAIGVSSNYEFERRAYSLCCPNPFRYSRTNSCCEQGSESERVRTSASNWSLEVALEVKPRNEWNCVQLEWQSLDGGWREERESQLTSAVLSISLPLPDRGRISCHNWNKWKTKTTERLFIQNFLMFVQKVLGKRAEIHLTDSEQQHNEHGAAQGRVAAATATTATFATATTAGNMLSRVETSYCR